MGSTASPKFQHAALNGAVSGVIAPDASNGSECKWIGSGDRCNGSAERRAAAAALAEEMLLSTAAQRQLPVGRDMRAPSSQSTT